MKKKKVPKEEKVGYLQIAKELSKCVRQYKTPSILSIVFIGLETLFECLIPFVMAQLINTLTKYDESGVNSNELLTTVLLYGGILLAMAVCSFACGLFAGRVSAKASVGFATNLRQDLFYKISAFSFTNIDKFTVSSLVTRQTTDITYIQLCYMLLIRIAMRSPLMLIFSVVMAAVMAPSMAWIYALLIPILAVIFLFLIVKAVPIFTRVFDRYDELNESVEENVRGIRVVKTYTREDFEKKKFFKASDDMRDQFVVGERLLALTNPFLTFFMYVSMLFIVWFGSYLVLDPNSSIEVGQISALITYGAQILSSLMMLSMVFVMIAMSTACLRRVYEVLVEQPTIHNPENPVKEVKDGSIVFDHVSFKYRPDAEKFALSDVNLTIHPGETIGIIGGTGSSKSTLVNLISRFYDVSEGKVLVGGVDVRNYDIETLRQNVSMVLQKNVLFSGTIKENLRWGNKNATDEEIKEACHIAQADTFVESFPKKYDSPILQGGTNVSGGQKQRLCIARAILKKPKVLIMDDSTSAVDTKTDAFIREGLKSSLPGTTKIIIAQRVSSVQEADKILVMDDGKIVNMGTHEELLRSSPIYKEIYDLQNRVGGEQK